MKCKTMKCSDETHSVIVSETQRQNNDPATGDVCRSRYSFRFGNLITRKYLFDVLSFALTFI